MIEDHTIALVDKAANVESTALKKSKTTSTSTPKRKRPVTALTQEDETEIYSPSAKKKKIASSRKANDKEKRLRRFRAHATSSYKERLNRATTQR